MVKPTPPANQTFTTFQVGSYTASSDTWTLTLDLNDSANFYLMNGSPQMPQPQKVTVNSFNVRTPGETVVRVQYKNRHIKAALTIRGSTPQAIVTNVHSLISAVEGLPYTLRIALPKAATYSYADVKNCVHNIPSDPLKLQQLAIVKAEVDFECYPFLRGDRLTLQNLVTNPGFEAPSGPGVQVFADALSNVNAYAVQAGSTPTTGPNNTYVDTVFANGTPVRYYRLGLGDSGTSALDIAGGGYTGTTHGSPTTGVAGGISGDTDTCYTFAAASSQSVSFPSTGMPTGNAAITLACWFKFASNPGSSQGIFGYGTTVGGLHNYIQMFLDSSGKLNADVGGTLVTSGSALATATWHFGCVTWDGTTLKLYVDGASTGTPTTPGAQTLAANLSTAIGASANPTAYFSGQIDEACVYAAPLTSGQITNVYNAGHSGASGTLANAASLATSARVSFGSPVWGAVNQWNFRFRFTTSEVLTLYLHYTDSSNSLSCQIASGGSNFLINHRVAGVSTTVASATITTSLQHEAYYWLSFTQFPSSTGNAPYLQAVLSWDNNGAIGTAISTLAGAAVSSSVALSGAPQFTVSGAACIFGGLSSGAGNAVTLFGPGGWVFQGITSGGGTTGTCSGAWDTNSLNTYPSGPMQSLGCGRIDLAPAGTVDSCWRVYRGSGVDGGPVGTWAVPVNAATDVLGVSAYVKSSGLSGSALLRLYVYEWDNTGAFLRSGVVQTITGNQATWALIGGTYTTGASCAYADFMLRVIDTTVSGESANATVWWDNCQAYDQTSTGQTSMPYCELRFPQSPAQLVVSGLLGDVPAPCLISAGSYLASWANNVTFYTAIGRRLQTSSSGLQLIGWAGTSSVGAASLDTAAYGGVDITSGAAASFSSPLLATPTAATLQGIYHLFHRLQSSESTAANLSVQPQISANLIVAQGTAITGALSAGANTWQAVDCGQVNAPPFGYGAATDLTQFTLGPSAAWSDASTPTWKGNWTALLPKDGSICLVAGKNVSGSAVTTQYRWVYVDGLAAPLGAAQSNPVIAPTLATTSGLTATAQPAPTLGTALPTAQGTTQQTTLANADAYVSLDPTLVGLNSNVGVDQLLVINYSSDGLVWPTLTEIQYSPLYLYPRV